MEFQNKSVNNIEVINNKRITFEHDSCKETWEYYKKIYFDEKGKCIINSDFVFNNSDQLVMSNYKRDKDNQKNIYCNEPTAKWPYVNRYYLLNNTINYSLNQEYPGEKANLSGDCDFNFNEKKIGFFERKIKEDYNDYPRTKEYAMNLLCKCNEMHHTLLNFSLMQTKGNMQRFKGECLNNGVYSSLDRADSLVAYLYSYYKLNDLQKGDSYMLVNANNNANILKEYLASFTDIYDYCMKIYFIDDKEFVDRMVKEGCMHIKNGSDVIRYMLLALEFWDRKEIKVKAFFNKIV